MTTLSEEPYLCPACGEPGVLHAVTSTSEFGARDLDLRPAEMRRSTMPFWVVRCHACAYAFDPHEDPDPLPDPDRVRAIVASPEYRALLADDSPAGDFVLRAHLCERSGRSADAGWASLHAAWARDDIGNEADADRHRLRAAALWRDALAGGEEIHPSPGAEHPLLADVLRRAGRFEAARAECERGLVRDDLDEGVRPALTYLLVLIGRRDRLRHTLAEL